MIGDRNLYLKMNTLNKKQNKEKGFTLIELVVAMTLFIVASTIISGIFIRSIRTQRQANHLTVLNSDSSLVIERINREVREGFDFSDPSTTDTCSDTLTFERTINGSTKEISYTLMDNNIQRKEGSGGTFQTLNSSEVNIDDLCFILTQETEDEPWRITMSMTAGSVDPNINYTSNIQTTISARSLPGDINN